MHKQSSRRRLGDTIEDETATESWPLSTRMIKQTSCCLSRDGTQSRPGSDGDDGAAWPGMGVKQTSLSNLPRQTSIKNLTEDEHMKMPRLVKQSSFESLPRGICDAKQSIGSIPKYPSRPQRRGVSRVSPKPNHRPKLTFRKDDSDETTYTLASMPRIVKQTSLTGAMLSSRGSLTGDVEYIGNGSNRRQQMAKQNSLPIPKRRSLTCYSKDKMDEKTGTLSSTRRLVKRTSLTGTRLSSCLPLIGNDEMEGSDPDRRERMAKQNSLTLPRRSIRSLYSKDKIDEMTDTLSSTLRLVEQAKYLDNGNTQASDLDVRRGRSILTFDCEDEEAVRTNWPRYLTRGLMRLVWRNKHPSRS
jgi:hypothetical protein